MKKRGLAMLLAAMLLLGLTGCGDKTEEIPAVELVPVEEPIPEPEPTGPAGTNPLTGESMEPEFENNRPVAVMLNNLKAAQPQLGNSQADIIYEVPAEGGITRMLAVYQTLEDLDALGSIRSARPYYMELALGHDALYVHAGGSPEAYDDIHAWKVDNMDGVNGGSDAQIFWRDKERRKAMDYEHTLVTSAEKIQEYLAEDHFRLEHQDGYVYTQAFVEDGTPVNGTPATEITLKFSNYKTGTFTYDSASGKYLAGQYGGAYMDGAANEQVSATNVLVLAASMKVLDSVGRLRVGLAGGEGTYFCGGKAVPIKWSKGDRNSQMVYTLADGTPLSLGKGNSYVCIMSPAMGSLSYQ